MNRTETIEAVRMGASLRRERIPARVYEVLVNIGTIIPGLDAPVIGAARPHYGHLRDGGLLVLSGSIGIGKTVTALFMACLDASVEDHDIGYRVVQQFHLPEFYFVPAQLVIDNEFDKTQLPQGMTKARKLKDLPEMLIIDDMGTEHIRDGGWSDTIMDKFIDARYRNKLATVVTTNLTEDQFKAKYRKRIADRVSEWGTWVRVEGESLRDYGKKGNGKLW